MNATVAVITPTKNRLPLLCERWIRVHRQTSTAGSISSSTTGRTMGPARNVTRRAAVDPRVRYIKRTGNTSGANVCPISA